MDQEKEDAARRSEKRRELRSLMRGKGFYYLASAPTINAMDEEEIDSMLMIVSAYKK